MRTQAMNSERRIGVAQYTAGRRRILALGALAALPWLGADSLAQTALAPYAGITSVEVFCNSAMLIEPVANPPFAQTIYRMDAMEQLLGQVNQRMNQQIAPGNEQQARAWAMSHQGQLKRALTPAAAALANAINRFHYYRLDRLPAIVINGRSAVYGVTSVAEAIARYQAHIQGKG